MLGAQQRDGRKARFKRPRPRRSSPQIFGKYRRSQTRQQLFKRDSDGQIHSPKFQSSPDELIARAVRPRLSSRRDTEAFGKRDWIVIIQRYRKRGSILAGTLKGKFPFMYQLGVALFGDWQSALSAAGFKQDSIPTDRHSKFIISGNKKK